jgi:protein SCO1
MSRRTSKGAVPAALLIAASTLAPAGAAARSRWGADYFPNVALTTHEGKVVRFYDDLLAGKVVAIDLIYTHCQYSCPLETARLAQVQRMLGDRVGKDVFFYSITLDPRRDTPEVLKAYAQKFGAGPGWLFLTGNADDIKLISKKLGLASDGPVPNADGHTPDLMIGDVAKGQWMRNSAVDNPRMLATTIERFLDGWQAASSRRSYADAPALSFTKGQYLYATRCAACHTIGEGDRVGPDLAGVTAARDGAWLTRFIAAPDRVLESGDPVARALYAKYKQVNMPNLSLNEADVAALIEYLAARDAEHAARQADAAAPAP